MNKLLLSIFVLISFNSFSQNLQSGLVAHFPLDGTGDDVSVLNIDGSVVNTTPSTGVLGMPLSALYFNESLPSTLIAGTSDRGISNQFSVSVWVKTSITGDHLISKYDWPSDQGYFLAIFQDKATVGGRDNSNNYLQLQGTSTITDGNWHHLVGTCDGNTWNIYVDCVLENTMTTTTPTPLFSNAIPLTIGYYYLGFSGDYLYYTGDLDDARIYNRVVTTQEISLLCDENLLSTNEIEPKNEVVVSTLNAEGLFGISWSGNENYFVEVYNLNGQIVFSMNKQGEIDLNTQSAGIYLLTVKGENGTIIHQQKIIKN